MSPYSACSIMDHQYIKIYTLFLGEPNYLPTLNHELWRVSGYGDRLEIILNLHGAQIPCHVSGLV